jgi:uncharacterized membrane protein
MKKNILLFNALMVIIACVPLLYLAFMWNSIPDQVPIHFNSKMEPDRMGSKSDLLSITSFMAGVSLITLLLLQNIHKFDPKRKNMPASSVFLKVGAGLVIFLAGLNMIIITASARGGDVLNHLLYPFLGILFAFLGNYMHSIKPNYFVGFRLPWTLSDDENWRRTHLLGGKIWFWAGVAFAIVSLLLPVTMIFPVFIVLLVIITLVPVVYSFLIFKNKV